MRLKLTKIHRRQVLKKILTNFFLGSVLINPFLLQSPSLAKVSQKNTADQIVVWKSKRRLVLFKDKKPIKTYRIRLGFNPEGPKRKEGDGRTPEGNYWITHKNPHSSFHKSLGISYPNKTDKILAKRHGSSPGKDIFIHGGPKNFFKHLLFDWTEGCIAVTDKEIDEIYEMVEPFTSIYITS